MVALSVSRLTLIYSAGLGTHKGRPYDYCRPHFLLEGDCLLNAGCRLQGEQHFGNLPTVLTPKLIELLQAAIKLVPVAAAYAI